MADTEGVLKNALDLMGFEEFEGKMLVVVPEQASIPQARQEFDETGNLKDPKLEERVRNVGPAGGAFRLFARLLRSE